MINLLKKLLGMRVYRDHITIGSLMVVFDKRKNSDCRYYDIDFQAPFYTLEDRNKAWEDYNFEEYEHHE